MDKLDKRHDETIYQLKTQMLHVEAEQRTHALKILEQERALDMCRMETADLKHQMLSLDAALLTATRLPALSPHMAVSTVAATTTPVEGAQGSRNLAHDTRATVTAHCGVGTLDAPVLPTCNTADIATHQSQHLTIAAGDAVKSTGSPRRGGGTVSEKIQFIHK